MGEVDVHALRGVDLDLFESEFVVILGPSGSGKSTLLNILGGLDIPTSGTVRYRDHDLTAADERGLTLYRREHVGFVFQFYNLIPSLTARENVELVTDIAVRPLPALDALAMVGLSERVDHFPSQLSGGEQQRIAIAYRVETSIVASERRNVLKVPTSALFRVGETWAVFAIRDGQAAQTAVQVGLRNAIEAEVLSGLDEGDQVIVHPGDTIASGVRVTPR